MGFEKPYIMGFESVMMHRLPLCWLCWHGSIYKLCAKLIWAPFHSKIGLKALLMQLEGKNSSHFLKEGVNQHWQSLFKCHSHHKRAQESPYKAQSCSLSVRFLSNISYNISFHRPCSPVTHDATCFLFFYIFFLPISEGAQIVSSHLLWTFSKNNNQT